MARRRYQTGCLFVRGKRRKVWVARFREDTLRTNGTIGRVNRSIVLGPVSEVGSKREALKILESHLRPINQGLRQPQATISFQSFVSEHFEPMILPTLKFSTQSGYRSVLKKHLVPRFGNERLCDIRRTDVQRYVLEKLQQGYSWEMANRIRDLLSKVLRTAVEWDYLSENPASGIKMPERTLKRPHTSLTVDQVRSLLNELTGTTRTIVLLAVMAGLRIGEILALRWGRIDFASGTLGVEENCYRGRFGTPKTCSSRRTVPLVSTLVRALMDHRACCLKTEPDDLLFSTSDGKPLDAGTLLTDRLKPACKQAGLRPIDFHTLRHTHSSLLHATGTPLKVAQAQLGHSSLAMTLGVYTHVLPNAQRDAVAKLEEVLFPNVPNSDGGVKAETEQVGFLQ